jgi:hypothetical protein
MSSRGSNSHHHAASLPSAAAQPASPDPAQQLDAVTTLSMMLQLPPLSLQQQQQQHHQQQQQQHQPQDLPMGSPLLLQSLSGSSGGPLGHHQLSLLQSLAPPVPASLQQQQMQQQQLQQLQMQQQQQQQQFQSAMQAVQAMQASQQQQQQHQQQYNWQVQQPPQQPPQQQMSFHNPSSSYPTSMSMTPLQHYGQFAPSSSSSSSAPQLVPNAQSAVTYASMPTSAAAVHAPAAASFMSAPHPSSSFLTLPGQGMNGGGGNGMSFLSPALSLSAAAAAASAAASASAGVSPISPTPRLHFPSHHSPAHHAAAHQAFTGTRLPILTPWLLSNRRRGLPPETLPTPPSGHVVDLVPGLGAQVRFQESLARGLGVLHTQPLLRVLPRTDLATSPATFVSSRQYKRLVARMASRARRAARGLGSSGAPKHLSRQLHAIRRVRGKGGRFLTAAEKAAMAAEEAARAAASAAGQGGGDQGSGGEQDDEQEGEEEEE